MRRAIQTPKRILITGCGRSGTKYISLLLRRLGLDVGHERMGRDGIASWTMAVNAASVPWGLSTTNFVFDNIFHQVRSPNDVIASATTFKPESWTFICAHTPISMAEPVLLRAAKYWYYWNLEAEKVAHWRYRIDDFPSVFAAFCARLQLLPDWNALNRLAPDVNTRRLGRATHLYEEICSRLHIETAPAIKRLLSSFTKAGAPNPVSWNLLRSLDTAMTERIQDMAVRYGYGA